MTTQSSSKKFFYKTDILKISSAVIITLTIVYLTNFTFYSTPINFSFVGNKITTDEMVILCEEYAKGNPITTIWEDPTRNLKNGVLEGFPILTSDLLDIINNNAIKDPINPSVSVIPDVIMFYLGQNGTTRYGLRNYGNIKLIAVGSKEGQLLIPPRGTEWRYVNAASIYDKANPCPGPGCPTKPTARLTPNEQ